MNDKLVMATANEILKCLHRHPHGADPAKCIHTFWINWGCSPEQLPVTEAEHRHLHRAGWIEHIERDADVVWRLAKRAM